VVFAIIGDGSLDAYTQGGWDGPNSFPWQRLVEGNPDGTRAIASFSAGLDVQGDAEVYFIFTSGGLARWDAGYPGAVYQIVKNNVDEFTTIRGTPDGNFLTGDGNGIEKYVYQPSTSNYVEYAGYPLKGSGIYDLAAADSNNFFYISSDSHLLQEYSNGAYHTFQI
jgi:hypothetical protein